MRRTFLSTGTPQTENQRWYVLQNWRQDPVVTIDEAGVQRERAQFSPYGRVFGIPAGDVGFDGAYSAGDSSAISGWSTGYQAYADVNLDGVIDGDDATSNTTATMGWDVLSRDGSTVGYAGYVQDDSIPTISHVRHRVYKSDLGRWVQRDPAGYVDGGSLYEYVQSSSQSSRDPYGLLRVDFTPGALALLIHFVGGTGTTKVLTGGLLDEYLGCPRVQRAVKQIKNDVDRIGLSLAESAVQQVDCACGGLPSVYSNSQSGSSTVSVQRSMLPSLLVS